MNDLRTAAQQALEALERSRHWSPLYRGSMGVINAITALRAALVAAAKDAEHQQTLALQQRSYEREIQLEVEAEREACAKLAESTVCDTHLPTGVRIYGTRAAAAIRARTP